MSIEKKFTMPLSRNKRLIQTKLSQGIIIIATSVLILSAICFTINSLYTHYHGVNYLPNHVSYAALVLIIIHQGFFVLYGRESQPAMIFREIFYFFLLMLIIAVASNAVQFTPYPRIDEWILQMEFGWNIHLQNVLAWTHSCPKIKQILSIIYDFLPYQMAYFPLLIIAMRRFDTIREYYFLMLFSLLAGYSLYYFFPTTGPASIIDSPYFIPAQQATNLKYTQIHQHLHPTTMEGGMVAFPSFHVIWGWFSLYLLRSVPMIFIPLLPLYILLVASCVLLGWHYPIDILGSVIIIGLSHFTYYRYTHSKLFFVTERPKQSFSEHPMDA